MCKQSTADLQSSSSKKVNVAEQNNHQNIQQNINCNRTSFTMHIIHVVTTALIILDHCNMVDQNTCHYKNFIEF